MNCYRSCTPAPRFLSCILKGLYFRADFGISTFVFQDIAIGVNCFQNAIAGFIGHSETQMSFVICGLVLKHLFKCLNCRFKLQLSERESAYVKLNVCKSRRVSRKFAIDSQCFIILIEGVIRLGQMAIRTNVSGGKDKCPLEMFSGFFVFF